MRILVFSDSHGSTFHMREALELQKGAELVIHLGDGERDLDGLSEALAGRKTVRVRGNCDFCSQAPANEIVTVGGVKILCTHGCGEYVKFGLETLLEKAASEGARIVLYGHTHVSVTDCRDGIYIMNPGSVRDGEYGVVDITKSGIVLLKMKTS